MNENHLEKDEEYSKKVEKKKLTFSWKGKARKIYIISKVLEDDEPLGKQMQDKTQGREGQLAVE